MVSDSERRCRTCNKVKHVSEFYSFLRHDRTSRPEGKRYYFSDCKPCACERRRIDRYGVTLAEVVARQGSETCPLCESRKADSLDHDHVTGEVRGALCRKCNLIMHYIDDAAWRARAEVYIARS